MDNVTMHGFQENQWARVGYRPLETVVDLGGTDVDCVTKGIFGLI